LASTEGLYPITGHSWRIGLNNLLRKEYKRRWDIRNILIQGAIWLLLLNFVLAMLLESETTGGSIVLGVTTFTFMAGLLAPIGVVMSAHGAILNEKKSGTAAWILSKPASRTSFIVAKLVTIGLGFLAIVILLQGLVAFAQLSIFQGSILPVGNFAGALLMLSLNVIFYLTLTIMLGTMFSKRVPVIGIPIALIIIQAFVLNLLHEVAEWLPYIFPGTLNDLARVFMMEAPMPSEWLMPVFTTLLLSATFVYLAIWRFQREEF
jgi:ABC-2 type transport system permease protein